MLFSSSCFSREVITCDFIGQLGNQMFQIAAAVGYALDHDCDACFPQIRTVLNGELNYRYIFHRLNTSPFPEGAEFYHYVDAIHSNIYSPIPYEKGRNIAIFGHYESEKYFEKHAGYIRQLFAPSEEITSLIQQKYGELLKEPTVAVHVRTFIPDGRNPNRNIGGAGWGYFIIAMSHFPHNYHFLVFSDDMNWTKRQFPVLGHKVTFIEGNPHYLDFYLMSACDHQIVSPESTFSWWAAWLNKNPNKTVIVADTWNDYCPNHTIPKGWLKLPKNPPYRLTVQKE